MFSGLSDPKGSISLSGLGSGCYHKAVGQWVYNRVRGKATLIIIYNQQKYFRSAFVATMIFFITIKAKATFATQGISSEDNLLTGTGVDGFKGLSSEDEGKERVDGVEEGAEACGKKLGAGMALGRPRKGRRVSRNFSS